MPKSVKVEDRVFIQIESYKQRFYKTDKDLADMIGISQFTFSKIRKTKSSSATTLSKLKEHGIIGGQDFLHNKRIKMVKEDKRTLDYLFKHTRGIDENKKEIIFDVYMFCLYKGGKFSDGVEMNYKAFRDKFEVPEDEPYSFGMYICRLLDLLIEITDGRRELKFHYFSKIEVSEGNGIVKFEFSPLFEKYLTSEK